MREIISIHVGQSGIDLGSVSWELFDMSHHIHSEYQKAFESQVSSHQLDAFYKETADHQFIPRALCIDTTQEHINTIKTTEVGMRLQDYQFINTHSNDFNNCYAYEYYTTSKEIIDSIRSQIRKLSAECDNLDGFLIYQSLNEGSTGLTSHLYDILNEEYDKANIFTFNIAPNIQKENNNSLDISNTLFSMAMNAKRCDLNILFDSKAVSSIWQNLLNFDNPSKSHNNQIIAQVIDSFTYSLRDKTYLTYDYSMKSIRDKLVTRRLSNFAYSSYANFALAGEPCYLPNSMSEYGKMLSLPEYTLLEFDSNLAYKIDSNIMYFNGRSIASKDIKNCFYEWKNQQLSNFNSNCSVMTVKNHKGHSVIPGGDLEYLPKTVCCVSNSTLIGEYIKDILKQNDVLKGRHKEKEVVNLYSKEGVETSDFDDARNCLNEVVESYNECFAVKND